MERHELEDHIDTVITTSRVAFQVLAILITSNALMSEPGKVADTIMPSVSLSLVLGVGMIARLVFLDEIARRLHPNENMFFPPEVANLASDVIESCDLVNKYGSFAYM